MINVIAGNEHDHGVSEHEEDSHEIVLDTTTVEETSSTVEVHEHDHSSLDGLFEVMFGFEHVVAEFFWNAVFIVTTYFITKGIALRKAHKYIDAKHGVTHEKKDY